VFRPLLSLLLLATVFLTGGKAIARDKPVIVTSFSVIGDWTQVIAGKEVELVNIIPPKSEAHGFQLSPSHAKSLRKAALVVAMNPELEPWLEAWAKANPDHGKILWLYPTPETAGQAADPHAWISPPEVVAMTKKLAEAIRSIDPSIDTQITYNQYLKEINQVDSELRSLFTKLPPDQRALISQHANLGFFARHYGLKVPGTLLLSGAAESADPSARHFSELLSLIRREKIRVVVSDDGQNDAFARRLTEDAGIPPPLALSFEYLQPAGQPGDSWTSMMLNNGRRLHQALSGR
jgi:ABC-type Zn uptake system ZnuABC Zn-binding protein ZnuA